MKDKVIRILSQIMNVPAEQLTDQSSPDTVEKWDSLRHMNLILALEEKFGVQFTDVEIVEILSIGIIIETLKEKGIQ